MRYLYFILTLFTVSNAYASDSESQFPNDLPEQGYVLIQASKEFYTFIPEVAVDLQNIMNSDPGRMELMGTTYKYFSRTLESHLKLEQYFPEKYRTTKANAPFFMNVRIGGKSSECLPLDPGKADLLDFFGQCNYQLAKGVALANIFEFVLHIHSQVFLGFASKHIKNWDSTAPVEQLFFEATKTKKTTNVEEHKLANTVLSSIAREHGRSYNSYMKVLFYFYFGRNYDQCLTTLGLHKDFETYIVSDRPFANELGADMNRFKLHVATRNYALCRHKLTLPFTHLDTHYPISEGIPRQKLLQAGLSDEYFTMADIGTETALKETMVGNTEHEKQMINAIASTSKIYKDDIDNLTEETKQLKARVENLQRLNKALVSKVQSLETDKAQSELLEDDSAINKKTLRQKEPSAPTFEAELKEARKDLQAAREEKNKFRRETTLLKQKLASSEKDNSQLQKEGETLSCKLEKAKQELQSEKQKCTALQQTALKNKDLLSKHEKQSKTLEEAQSDLQKEQQKCKALQKAAQQCHDLLDKQESANEESLKTIREMGKDIKDLTKRVEETEALRKKAYKEMVSFTEEKAAQVIALQEKAEMSELYYRAACEDNARGAMCYQTLLMNYNMALQEIGSLRIEISNLQKDLAVAQVKLENNKSNRKSGDAAEGSCNN